MIESRIPPDRREFIEALPSMAERLKKIRAEEAAAQKVAAEC